MNYQVKISDPSLKQQLGAKSKAHHKRAACDRKTSSTAVLERRRNDLSPILPIETRKIASLKTADRRTRRTDQSQLRKVIESLKKFGVCSPIIIRNDGTIVHGHVVVEAAAKIGLTEISCVVLDHLTAAEARMLHITLNRLGETGGWDLETLQVELVELSDLGQDLDVLGFEVEELDIVLTDDEHEADEEVIPGPPEKPVSHLGDLFELGQHRLVCGDSLDNGTYDKLLVGKRAQAVFTDPPWNLPAKFIGGLGKKQHADFKQGYGELSDAELDQFFEDFLTHCSGHMAPGAVAYACIDWRHYTALVEAAHKADLKQINMAVWYKQIGGMGGLYRSAHELVPVFCKGDSPATNNVKLGKHGRNRTNVWEYAGANTPGSSAAKALEFHPSPKPVELVADAILDVTKAGDIVLDPFLGSGTTLLAAEKTRRIAYTIELDPKYVDVAIRRWEAFTGKQAVHGETGLSFTELAALRAEPDDTAL